MPASLRHHLFSASFAIMERTWLDSLLAPLARGRGAILMFHHVRPWVPRDFAPNRLLEITPDFLDATLTFVTAAGFDIIPLDAVADRLAAPQKRPFVVITFDDGYRDNAVHAEPILRRHGAPWTVFVTSDFVEGRGRLWWLELEEAVRRLPSITATLDGATLTLPAATAVEKKAAFDTLYWRLRAGPEAALLSVIAELADVAGFATGALASELCLDAAELARLAAAPGVSIGGHTRSHPMLAKHGAETVRRELSESRSLLEAQLGVKIRYLSYPVGDPTSAGPRDFAIARELGYEGAVTTRPGHLFAGHARHMHALPRVSINGNYQNTRALRALLSGVPFFAWNRGRRVNVA